MKKLFACAALLSLALVAAARPAAPPPADNDNPNAPVAIGAKVADFTLPGADGREVSLSLAKGARGTVIIFVSTRCPVSNAYNARMEKLAQDLRARGVNVIGINSNAAETPDEMRQHASENKLSFTLLKDAGNKVADRFGATVTPEAFLLDASNRLVYRGRIDNSRNGDSITSEDLRTAVDETLAGKPVAKSAVPAFGCSIKRG